MLDFKGSWEDHLHLMSSRTTTASRSVFKWHYMKLRTGENAG